MSIRSVMSEVKAAIRGGTPEKPELLTQLEARRIKREIKANGATVGELKVAVDTWETAHRPHTDAVGEGPSYTITPAASRELNALFVEMNVPAGENEEPTRQLIDIVMQNVGSNLQDYKTAKPNTKHLVALQFWRDAAVGGSLETAYVDPTKNHFYWSTQNASARTGEQFFGPFGMQVEPDCG